MKLNRRLVLKSSAACLAMPWFEALASPNETLAKRFVAFYVPNGMHMVDFRAKQDGLLSEQTLPYILSPLEKIKNKITLVNGLANKPGNADGAGDHASGTGSFMSCVKARKTKGDNIKNGISIDQVIANKLRGSTPIHSLQLGLEGGSAIGDCDSGYSCAYVRNISWAGEKQPLSKIVNPRLLFDQLFTGTDPNETAALRELRRIKQKSILDYLSEQTLALKKSISFKDKQKLDEYQTSIYELEHKLNSNVNGSCNNIELESTIGNLPKHSELMNDLMVAALQCGHTNVISYMMGNGGSNRSFPFLDINESHHNISHHQGNKDNHEKLKKINHWELEQFADLVTKLDNIQEGEATLLDQCCLFLSSEVSDGDRHNHTDLPVIYAGSLGGKLKTGSAITNKFKPISEFYMAIANGMDVPLENFGNGYRASKSILV
ncbi:MAG: DUF1552 domain-containing protein [Saccharospirillaceae bacterium]|nr:DUF1552 domain-containing protein [Pseudomonadales bacterium]NRB77729.1 DUF1552 domain-containing protein [Saccharospirillaceae bacterium]